MLRVPIGPNRGVSVIGGQRVISWSTVAPSDSYPHPSAPDRRFAEPVTRSPWRRLVALVCLAQVVVLVGFSIFFLVEIVRGHALDPARAVMNVVMMLLVAAGLVAIARGWRVGATWQGTPTVLWHALLLPVAWSLFQAGQWGWFAFVAGAIALAGFGVIRVAAAEAD